MITKNYDVILRIPEPNNIPLCFKVVQNDVNVYSITVKVFNEATEINYSEVNSATITFVKSDGNVVQGDMTVGANALSYTMGTNEIACSGNVLASVQLIGSSNERITTARFRFEVIGDLINESVVKSTTEFAALQALKAELEGIDVVNLSNELAAHKADLASLLAGGEVFSATLQNGWTGTLRYSKNDLGQVKVVGDLIAGTVALATIIAELPVGYRPSRATPFLVYNTTTSAVLRFQLSASGVIVIREAVAATGNGIQFNFIFPI